MSPAARVVRVRSLALRDAQAQAGRRVAELAAAENILVRLDEIGRSYAPRSVSSGTALAALAAAQDRLARARAASENRRAAAARQLTDATLATAVAHAALDAAQAVRDRAQAVAALQAERRRLENAASMARPLLMMGGDTP